MFSDLTLIKTFNWKLYLGLFGFIILVVIYIKHKLTFWTKQVIPYELFVLNSWFTDSINELDKNNTKKLGKVFGTYKFLTPVLCVSDIKLVQKIMVTEFHNFFEQRTWFVESQILENSLFASQYSQWRRQKSIISSAFYSRKLKLLSPVMDKSVDQLIQSLNSVVESGEVVNVSDYFTSFSLYFMLNVVFDIEVGELSKFKHPIITSYKKFITKKMSLAHSICFVHPVLTRILNLYFMSYKSIGKLREILENAIKTRDYTKKSEIRSEIGFIDILLSFESEFGDQDTSLTSREIKDNLIALFIAATESIAKTLSYCIYYLAEYSDIQEKVFNEVCDKIKNQDNINWETLRELSYMEAFIKEVLRFTTPFPRFERIVKKDFYLETEDLGRIFLPKNSIVSVLASAVHMDGDYFKDPEVFNPNRFLPEYKELMNPIAFIPFANGPRNCIGMKYAFFHIKHLLAHILLNFKIECLDDPELKARTMFFGNQTKINSNNLIECKFNIKFVKHYNNYKKDVI